MCKKWNQELSESRTNLFIVEILSSVLCGSLDGRRVWGRMDTCMCTAESPHCSSETITTLLISYIPIWNKTFNKEKEIFDWGYHRDCKYTFLIFFHSIFSSFWSGGLRVAHVYVHNEPHEGGKESYLLALHCHCFLTMASFSSSSFSLSLLLLLTSAWWMFLLVVHQAHGM